MGTTQENTSTLDRVVEDDEVREVLQAALDHEHDGGSDTQYPWKPEDIGASESVLSRLTDAQIVSGPVGTYYHLRDPDAVQDAIERFEGDKRPKVASVVDNPEEQGIPEDIFEPIVGYNDIKRRFMRALDSNSVRQSILLIGPRGSAKSVFMEEILRLPNTVLITGKDATVAGVEEELLQNPQFVVVDEFDKLPSDVFDVFLNWQDPNMPFKVSKSNRSGRIEDAAPVFATGNETHRIPDPNMDRFWDFYFERYDQDQFTEVCRRLMPREFDISEDLAEYIASSLRGYDPGATIRDAERIADVADDRSTVDEEIEIMQEYGSNDR